MVIRTIGGWLVLVLCLMIGTQAAQAAETEVFEGDVVRTAESEIVLRVGDEDKTFTIDEATMISLDGVMIDDVMQLGMGVAASVTAEKDNTDDSWRAQMIVAHSAPAQAEETPAR